MTAKLRSRLLLALVGGVAVVGVGLYIYAGPYVFGMLLRGRLSYWMVIKADDPELPEPMRLVLHGNAPLAIAGSLDWRTVAQGVDVGELPVLGNDKEVDRLYLSRIDPAYYRFVAASAPSGTMTVDDWLTRLGAVAVVNGSYFSRRGYPDTPFISDGESLGPADYDATQGAFVADAEAASIRDLSRESWTSAFRGATNAMVSYPLLVRPDRAAPAIKDSRWLANRTFVARDVLGRIILGTSASAFFTLRGLSDFLRNSPLGLEIALNLDGGPVACQAVSAGAFKRSVCGRWELQSNGAEVHILRWTSDRWGLPVALAAIPKQPTSSSSKP